MHKTRIHFQKLILAVTAGILVMVSACQPSPLAPLLPANTPTAAPIDALITTPENRSTQTVSSDSIFIPDAAKPTSSQIDMDGTSLKGVRINFWHTWKGAELRVVESVVAEFNRSNIWGITVIPQTFGSVQLLRNKIEQNAQSSHLPGVIAAPIEELRAFQITQNVIVNLDNYSEDANWGFSPEEIEQFYPVYWEQDIYDGVRLGIPAIRSTAVLFYNKTWASELSFDTPPRTPLDFNRQTCAAATQNPVEENMGGYILDTSHPAALNWLRVYDPAIAARMDAGDYTFNNPATTETIAFLRKLVDSSCAWRSTAPEPYEYFAKRQAFVYSGKLEDVVAQSTANYRFSSTDQWSIIPYPSDTGKQTLLVNGQSYAVLKSTPPQQLASWLFIRWLSLPRHHARLVQASATLPVMASEMKTLEYFSRRYPQWADLVNNLPEIKPEPAIFQWRTVRLILSDGIWQSLQYYIPPSEFPGLLKEMDATIGEVLSRQQE